ncbi:hypothetical protein [Lichenicoccus sp.]|uniref:hypothetical protein n=1 Tax=Lichenicoccus sp. TaxID=2781899 RepID=UPI003D1407B4
MMFGSNILDVLLGVVFTFLAVSMAASAITESIASLFKLRQKTLLAGVKALLNDPGFDGLAHEIYAHALVNPLAPGADSRIRPAYIPPRGFALALHDVLQARDPNRPIGEIVSAMADPQLRQALLALLAAADNRVPVFQIELAGWFEAAMERVSGWYKRQTQAIAFAVGFVIAAILNADVLHVTQTLWTRPVLAEMLTLGLRGDRPDFDRVVGRLDASTLLGWNGWQTDPRHHGIGLLLMLVGWLIAAAASLFGAPFWFDTLQRVIWIRGTGSVTPKSTL